MNRTNSQLNETMVWILGLITFIGALFAIRALFMFFSIITTNQYNFSTLDFMAEITVLAGIYTIQINLTKLLQSIRLDFDLSNSCGSHLRYAISFLPIIGFTAQSLNSREIAARRGLNKLAALSLPVWGILLPAKIFFTITAHVLTFITILSSKSMNTRQNISSEYFDTTYWQNAEIKNYLFFSPFPQFMAAPETIIVDNLLNLLFFIIIAILLWRTLPKISGEKYSNAICGYAKLAVYGSSSGLLLFFGMFFYNFLIYWHNQQWLEQNNIPTSTTHLQISRPISPDDQARKEKFDRYIDSIKSNKHFQLLEELTECRIISPDDCDNLAALLDEKNSFIPELTNFYNRKLELTPPMTPLERQQITAYQNMLQVNINFLRMRLACDQGDHARAIKLFADNLNFARQSVSSLQFNPRNNILLYNLQQMAYLMAQYQFTEPELRELQEIVEDFTPVIDAELIRLPLKLQQLGAPILAMAQGATLCEGDIFLYAEQCAKFSPRRFTPWPLPFYQFSDSSRFTAWGNAQLHSTFVNTKIYEIMNSNSRDMNEKLDQANQYSEYYAKKHPYVWVNPIYRHMRYLNRYKINLQIFSLGCEIKLFQRRHGNLPQNLSELNQPQLIMNQETKKPFVYLPITSDFIEYNAVNIFDEIKNTTLKAKTSSPHINTPPGKEFRSGRLSGYIIFFDRTSTNNLNRFFSKNSTFYSHDNSILFLRSSLIPEIKKTNF